MAIPSLATVKAKVTSEEIASYEADITKYLETPGTLEFLEDTTRPNRAVVRTYPGKVLTPQGIDALEASIATAGYTAGVVTNGFEPPRQGIGASGAPARPQVTVTFKPAAPVTPPVGGS